MGRILYGVMGDSMGHVSRSLAVARSMPNHEFLFVGADRVRELEAQGYNVEYVPHLQTIYEDNRVDVVATFLSGAKTILRRGTGIARLAHTIKSFDPDLILTDYEYFTPRAARRVGRPCVSLDHQHLLTHCVYDPPEGQLLSRFLTCFLIRRLYSLSERHLIISFRQLPPTDPATVEVFPPVLRPEVLLHEASEGDHVLVYWSKASTFESLFTFVEDTNRKIIVYGLGESPPKGNLIFKSHSVHGFLEDLASCRFLVSTAGHSLISEALHYGKPMLCFPVHLAYEQLINAHFLEESGFGQHLPGLPADPGVFKAFEAKLDTFRERISSHNFYGNDQVAARLEQLIRDGSDPGP